MARTYRLEHFAKGTGATVVPNDEATDSPERSELSTVRLPPRPRKPRTQRQTSASPLPPGHVRKKATGEIGRVQSVDPGAGTATVFWLRQGRSSTVPLASISRR
jgi:hypothetical protein